MAAKWLGGECGGADCVVRAGVDDPFGTVRARCRTARSGRVLLSTVPEDGEDAAKVGLFVRATADSLQVTSRNVVLLDVPRAQAQSAPGCVVKIRGGDDACTAPSRTCRPPRISVRPRMIRP